jgi:hypothetical protein
MENPFIHNIEILSLNVVLVGKIDVETDLGAVTISREGREYILDDVQSYSTFEDGITSIETDLERDDELFSDCPYDITAEDLISDDLKVEFYISTENEIESMTLFIRIGGAYGMTKAINVIQE